MHLLKVMPLRGRKFGVLSPKIRIRNKNKIIVNNQNHVAPALQIEGVRVQQVFVSKAKSCACVSAS
jgi:hypothetical protein